MVPHEKPTPAAVVTVPCPPKLLHPNGSHGRPHGRAAVVAKYKDASVAAIHRQQGSDLGLSRALIELRYLFGCDRAGRRRKKHDPDNLIAWAKAAIDSLVVAGVLSNDRSIAYAPPVQQCDVSQSFDLLEIAVYRLDGICPVCMRVLDEERTADRS